MKTFWGRIPPHSPTRFVPSALARIYLVTKNLATALVMFKSDQSRVKFKLGR